MSDHEHISELIPADVLGSLDNDEAELVTSHLIDCPTCRAEAEAYQQIADGLALAAPSVAPPPDLRNRLLESIRPTNVSRTAQTESWWAGMVGALRRPVPAWSLPAILIFLAVAWFFLTGLFSSSVPQEGTMKTLTLAATEAASDAQGMLVIGSDGDEGGLVVEDLPALDVDQQYQLWLVDRDGRSASGAIFSVDADGYGTTMVASPLPLTSYAAFCVTIEPAGGSSEPTGQMVLGFEY